MASSLFREADQVTGAGTKSAAKIYKPNGSGAIDVVNDYLWTLTPKEGRKEIPTIVLTEYEVDETIISRQIDFYVNGIAGASQNLLGTEGGNADFLSPYDQLFPKDKWTEFYYVFPFYSDINFEVNTPQWASLDTLEAGAKATADLGSLVHPAIGQALEKGFQIAGNLALAGAAAFYPKVGIMDRPKLWESHDFRSYTIKLPLYNTYNTDPQKPEWKKNRDLCELLVNQNLYNKLTFITGIPPVFYEVLIPGQHYSPAACVTNLTIYNRGNLRQFEADGFTYNVPDVYEINMTLTDLVIPSKNLFQAISNPTVRSNLVRRSQQGASDTVTSTLGNVVDTVGDVASTVSNTLESAGNTFSNILRGGLNLITPSNTPGINFQSQFTSPPSP